MNADNTSVALNNASLSQLALFSPLEIIVSKGLQVPNAV
jgi:hypothetical protein